MNKNLIKFGTDGWRAITDKDFTPENIARLIQAYCDVHRADIGHTLYVGYDRRGNSEASSRLVAEILAANGFKVKLSKQFCPTPCISWMVKTNKALAGVMVTASHNPPQWNGIKFKEGYGGAASPAYTDPIEAQILKNDAEGKKPNHADFDALVKQDMIDFFDPQTTYVAHLKNFVDVALIKKSNFKIVVDPLFGAGTDYLKAVLGVDVIQIHGEADPTFGGLNPEPIDKNLGALFNAVREHKAHVGLATDGDADRIGASDEFGNYVNAHQIFALLIKHNILNKKFSGAIVKSVSSSVVIEKICKKLNLNVIETPIGFKHICAELQKTNALMGGEESGGISLREHVHERDGVLNELLLLEMMAMEKKTLSQLLNDIDNEFGKFYYDRNDYHLNDAKIAEVKNVMARGDIGEIAGVQVIRHNNLDGFKLILADESWLLVRASGTEPLLRVYAEAPSKARVEALLGFAKSWLGL